MYLMIEDIKSASLEVLRQIHKICEMEEIRYSLAYGTLLGACRHKGFIPWDDDIDIIMIRSDYEKFLKYCTNHDTPFSLKTVSTDGRYHYLFAKACNKNTKVEELYGNRQNCDLGIYVDIFPIDYVGETIEESKTNIHATKFQRSLLVAYNWKRFFKSNSSKWYVEPIRFFFFLSSRYINIKYIEKKIQQYYSQNEIQKFVANSVDNTYGDKEIMPAEFFEEYELVEFEHEFFYSIKRRDEYLKQLYGNYMEMPPVEKRVTHHTFKAKWKK